MKTQKEIEQLASVRCDTWGEACAFYDGYTQCQKDMDDEIKKQIYDFTVDLKESTSTYVKQNCEGAIFGLNRLLQSLNKQD
jgi:hypothetical protein